MSWKTLSAYRKWRVEVLRANRNGVNVVRFDAVQTVKGEIKCLTLNLKMA